jgi:hypothetical protein
MIALLVSKDLGTLEALNSWIWVASNILVFAVFVGAALFSIGYPLLFKIQTTGGWRMWRAILSIAGFGFLSVLGVFVDPETTPWWQLPPSVIWWRPIVRLLVFGVVAHSFASLCAYLLQRRFAPNRLVIRPEISQLMEAELRLNYGTGAGLPDPHAIAMLLTESGWTKVGLTDPPQATLGVVPRRFHRR